ncbi:hypothetical protein K1T71_006923 [Dendrolimus kikuchii]|uniref:Uncharacterized protein n=1 Tax=Dendrolimus kikuchii TaxID=765133 RepID=A0ACC1CYY8_9NEOP|nr:hypothetical protein K1T71_006923 [Dendrolimus kikuchii]
MFVCPVFLNWFILRFRLPTDPIVAYCWSNRWILKGMYLLHAGVVRNCMCSVGLISILIYSLAWSPLTLLGWLVVYKSLRNLRFNRNPSSNMRCLCTYFKTISGQPSFARAFARLDGYHPWSKVCRHNNLELCSGISDQSNCNSLAEQLANEGINFHFIPAYSPHFGGIWEAGVKSTKYHLQRALGNCNLTFEELSTLLVQVEAILNSRPLTPLSSDPDDCTPLTPGHFLIGRPLTSLPQPDYQNYSISHLTRFQRIEQLRQHFWTRWSKEFVAELQQRVKWRSCKDSLKLDSLVVVKDENLPPLKWKLGRVVAVHPGSDGIVRVADIKTATGVIRRAFNRICPLPVSTGSV